MTPQKSFTLQEEGAWVMRWAGACEEGCAGHGMRLDARGSYFGPCAEGAGS